MQKQLMRCVKRYCLFNHSRLSVELQLFLEDPSLDQDCEFLWRFAKACIIWANSMEKKNSLRKTVIFEGRGYALKAYTINENSFEALRWTAVLTGAATEFLGVRERIREGKVFTDYLDRAIAIEPKEFTLLHLRGRFSFEVANLSWLEKKVANTLFSGVPDCTTEDALSDFLEAEKYAPFAWADNLLFIARCYAVKKEKKLAADYIKKIEAMDKLEDAVVEGLKEVRNSLAKK
ncbi:unnamed protein product [Enterobius vermicularis]|uniref:TPR_REGION domain-containing protein n=1 Tax=Enterobius vermicularis TaxID=51028 RepID=A0A0N4VAG7_ENTVE|nr:unnamed protein product [Enterobius vermicularis]